MERDEDRRRVNEPGRGGGTSGTGPPEASGRDGGGVAEAGDRRDEAEKEGRIAGTGSSVARSGRASSESGDPPPNPPGAGDPGGMSGAAARRAPHDRRPPGGSSPAGDDGEE